MRHDHNRPVSELSQVAEQPSLGRRIKCTSRLIEQQDRGFREDRPCDRQSLGLSLRKTRAALAERGIQSIIEFVHEAFGTRHA